MKASTIKKNVKLLTRCKQPTFIWGPPGVGKSAVIKQAADDLGINLVDVRALLLDPVDLRGLPHVNGDGRAHWCVPDFLPREGEGILFLDELNAAPRLVQAACYQLLLDRKLGEYTLPDGWSVISAGNREIDRAVTERMPSALANRFVHLNFEVNLDDWVAWALKNDIPTEVIAFIRFRPELLHNFEPQKNDQEKAFPSPRSWEFVGRIHKQNPDADSEFELYAGTVGQAAATEFVEYLKLYREMPSVDLVLLHPDKAPVPTKPAVLWAISTALARKAGENTIKNIITYANRLPADFSVKTLLDSVAQCPNVVKCRAFLEWASKHNDVILGV